MSENLEELRKSKEVLERSLVQEYLELEHLMSGAFLVERREELRRLYEEHDAVYAAKAYFDQNGQRINDSNLVRQRMTILDYQICDCAETIDMITSGHRAQEHLQSLTEMHAELRDINEKIKCIEQNSSG